MSEGFVVEVPEHMLIEILVPGPKGNPGEPGPQGPQGDQGPPGEGGGTDPNAIPKYYEYTEEDAETQWITRLLTVEEPDVNLPDIARHYIGTHLASWLNEWGALRGVVPYGWGDALVRGIRQDDDFATNGRFMELVDRRTGSDYTVMYGRNRLNGNLVRNDINMGDTYITNDYVNDENIENLPLGVLVVEIEE